jgi:small-conductance mechanosensitive channel
MREQISAWSAQIVPWLLEHGIRILVILLAAFVINFVAKRFISRIIRISVTMHSHSSVIAEQKREQTLIQIFSWTIKVMLVLVVLMLIMHEVGIPIGPMLAGAGILGLAVGFGGQYLIRDFITGFFMILENQYRIGDVVSLDQTSGVVENISLRMTTLRDLDGTVHHVPHGDIKRVANQSMDWARINLNLNISYSTDLERVIGIIDKVGLELASDPAWKEFVIKPPSFLRVEDFSESSVVLKVLGETVPLQQWSVTGELRRRIKLAFDKEGIEMPLPQRVVHQITSPEKGGEIQTSVD